MTRFKLRTLIVLTALLPAAFGMLWRCGQIEADTDVDTDGRWISVRVCRYQATVLPTGVNLLRVVEWMRVEPSRYVVIVDGKERRPAPCVAEQRKDHPWNSREWLPIYEHVGHLSWSDGP